MKPDDISGLLDEKAEIIRALLETAKAQNQALKSDDFQRTMSLDERKMALLEKLSGNDASLKVLMQGVSGSDKTIQLKAEKINLSFEELINLERQNNVLANDAVALLSGERVNAYMKGKALK